MALPLLSSRLSNVNLLEWSDYVVPNISKQDTGDECSLFTWSKNRGKKQVLNPTLPMRPYSATQVMLSMGFTST